GPIDAKRLALDHQDKLYRTEAYVANDGKVGIKRMLLCLEDGMFCYFDIGHIKVFGPTPQSAAQLAEEFRQYVKPKNPDKAGFHLLSFADGTIDTEFVETEALISFSKDDLALHYGNDFVA